MTEDEPPSLPPRAWAQGHAVDNGVGRRPLLPSPRPLCIVQAERTMEAPKTLLYIIYLCLSAPNLEQGTRDAVRHRALPGII